MNAVRRTASTDSGPTRSPAQAAQEERDRELVRRVATGDRAAFEHLYRAYARRLGGYLFKLLRQPEWVEEALDDVMLVVWQKADRYDGSSRVSTWLFGIAHRKALKMSEQRRRHLRAVYPPPEEQPLPPRPADPEEQTLQRDQLRQLARGIERLPPDQRAVVELTFFEGRSYAEIAEVMDCPVNTVKTRMFHARKSLARHGARGAGPAGAER